MSLKPEQNISELWFYAASALTGEGVFNFSAVLNETELTAKINKRRGRCHGDLDALTARVFTAHNGTRTTAQNLSILKYAAWQRERSHRPPCFLSDGGFKQQRRVSICGGVFFSFSYRVRGNSHLGSEGSSSSETLASMGPSLEDRRAIRTSGVLEFMEELESKDTCLGAKTNCYRL